MKFVGIFAALSVAVLALAAERRQGACHVTVDTRWDTGELMQLPKSRPSLTLSRTKLPLLVRPIRQLFFPCRILTWSDSGVPHDAGDVARRVVGI
jgi:hypothetical protein